MKKNKLKHPKFAESKAFKVKLRDGSDIPEEAPMKMASGGEVEKMEEDYTDKPDKGYGKIIFKAEGGEVMPEEPKERYASLTDAIMAKRRKMAEGGAVGPGSDMADIEHENNVEHPNYFYERNEDFALKENFDEDMLGMSQPEDSNLKGDRSARIAEIRRKPKMKRV